MYKSNIPELGKTKVMLKEGHSVKVIAGTFTGPHTFTLVDHSYRGYDMVDDDGNRLLECFLDGNFQIIE